MNKYLYTTRTYGARIKSGKWSMNLFLDKSCMYNLWWRAPACIGLTTPVFISVVCLKLCESFHLQTWSNLIFIAVIFHQNLRKDILNCKSTYSWKLHYKSTRAVDPNKILVFSESCFYCSSLCNWDWTLLISQYKTYTCFPFR